MAVPAYGGRGVRGGVPALKTVFDLHAGVFVARGDRAKLERVARYLLRPALALDRIRLIDG